MDDNSLSACSLPQHISHPLFVAANSSTLEKALEILTETSRTSDGRSDLAAKNILHAVLLLCQNLSYPSSRLLLLLSLKLLRNLCAGELTNQNSFVEHDGVTILLTTLHSVITCDSDFAIIRMGLQVLANVSLAGELHQLAIWDKFFPLMFVQISSVRRRETCDPLCMVIYTCCDGSNELFGKLCGDQGLPILVEIVRTASVVQFLVKKGRVVTPHADYCLPGITRATVMDLVAKERIILEERRVSLSEFHTADEVWTTGTMGELSPVVKIDGRVIGDGHVGPVTRRLQSAFTKLTEESGVRIPTYRKA